MLKRLFAALILGGPAAAAAAVPGPESAPPAAAAVFTIPSGDCASVGADGMPWPECGLQAYAMNDEGSRILTVSGQGVIQLWDGQGREIRRIDWANQLSGAAGYPNGHALIAGEVGIAVTHHNQLVLIRLGDGEILAQRVLDLMLVGELRLIGGGRVFAEIEDRAWKFGVREIVLPTGELRDVPGATDLMRAGPGYWVTGEGPPFLIHRPDAAEVSSERSCMPGSARFCFWRDDKGSLLHAFDMREGRWRSITVDAFDEYTIIDFVDAGGALYAVRCRPTMTGPSRRPCSILDFAAGRSIYDFEAENLRAVGALDERGRPEIRLGLYQGEAGREDRRVAADGAMRVIDPRGRSNLDAPGGGLILAGEAEGTSLFVDAAGRTVALLPFAAQACGDGWPTWTGYCRVSADARRWLVPSHRPDDFDRHLAVTLYEIPAPL